MSASSKPDGAYVLRYGPKDSFLLGWILLILAALACILVVLLQDQVARRVLLVVAVLCGAGAASFLRVVSRLKRQSAWYLCFEPMRVRVNLFDYTKAGSGPPPEAAILTIPRNQLILIRKATKIVYDDGDKFYVDMHVSHAAWLEAKRIRSEFQPHINPLTSHDREGFVQTFDGDILRIRLDHSRWPKELDTYWRSCQYDIADEHDIQHTSNIDMKRTAPKKSP